MVFRKGRGARGGRAVALVVASLVHVAWAGPDDDFARGRLAFHNDDLMGAMQALGRAAAADHTAAQTLLAYILDRAEENEEAVRLYRLAADKGDADALFGLAGMYAGGEGVQRDDSQALTLYRQAAAAGHQHAHMVLAEAHLAGTLGLATDRERALELLRQVAASGYQPARQRLETLTAKGGS